MSFTLRPHQAHDFQRLRAELKRVRATMLVAACGYGKGVIATKIIAGTKERSKNVLFLVHGRDRVNDAAERVTKLGIEHGVLMGSRRREHWHSVQIASSDTVHRMAVKPEADLILVDECHLGLSPTFRGVLDCYPNAKIIGMTATPVLGNGHALGVRSGGIFESMICGPSVRQLIGDGYLVGSRVIAPPAPADLAGLRKKKTGEFDGEQGAAICDTSKIIGDIVDHWKRYSSDRKTVAFGFNQKHAWDIAESFRAAGINWAYVDADTPDGDIHTPGTRKFLWHQYDHGDLVGISSCNVVSIGWDHSICKTLLLCAKTASFPLYHQRLGRGSRPHPGYDHFRIHDHTGNLYEFEDRGAYFESEIDWQLDGDAVRVSASDYTTRITTCKVPLKVPTSGVPDLFHGPVTPDGKWMLPCFQAFETGPTQCPYCGLPVEKPVREIKVEAGELHEITPAERAAAEERLRAESVRKAEYLDLVRLTKERNYKSGYPSIVFKQKFGYWPPRGWKQEVERLEGLTI